MAQPRACLQPEENPRRLLIGQRAGLWVSAGSHRANITQLSVSKANRVSNVSCDTDAHYTGTDRKNNNNNNPRNAGNGQRRSRPADREGEAVSAVRTERSGAAVVIWSPENLPQHPGQR